MTSLRNRCCNAFHWTAAINISADESIFAGLPHSTQIHRCGKPFPFGRTNATRGKSDKYTRCRRHSHPPWQCRPQNRHKNLQRLHCILECVLVHNLLQGIVLLRLKAPVGRPNGVSQRVRRCSSCACAMRPNSPGAAPQFHPPLISQPPRTCRWRCDISSANALGHAAHTAFSLTFCPGWPRPLLQMQQATPWARAAAQREVRLTQCTSILLRWAAPSLTDTPLVQELPLSLMQSFRESSSRALVLQKEL